ncbi:MAG: hypothetical protein JWO13_3128 [Acidobacteriales bacterium]|nr:hypothetical protein [Terriglobales bacterium]
MALFYVTYDLIKTKDYEKLFARLKEYKAQRVLLSVWAFRRENTTTAALRDDLKNYIDSDDRLLVIESADWSSRNLLVDPNKL